MIDEINATRTAHIMTIEDPIEYLHRDKKSVINQREIGVDTTSLLALRSALRQDPDVILVGEMRDFETIQTALVAAQTGHLVFSTLHTLDATETINRIIARSATSSRSACSSRQRAARRGVAAPHAEAARRGPRAGGGVLTSTAFIRDCIADREKTPRSTAPSPKARRRTGCRRSTSRSSASTNRVSWSSKKRCAGRRTSTTSSSRSRALNTAEMARDQMAGVGAV